MDYFISVTKLPEQRSVGGMFVAVDAREELPAAIEAVFEFEATVLVVRLCSDHTIPRNLFGKFLTNEDLSLLFGAVEDVAVRQEEDGSLRMVRKGIHCNVQN